MRLFGTVSLGMKAADRRLDLVRAAPCQAPFPGWFSPPRWRPDPRASDLALPVEPAGLQRQRAPFVESRAAASGRAVQGLPGTRATAVRWPEASSRHVPGGWTRHRDLAG